MSVSELGMQTGGANNTVSPGWYALLNVGCTQGWERSLSPGKALAIFNLALSRSHGLKLCTLNVLGIVWLAPLLHSTWHFLWWPDPIVPLYLWQWGFTKLVKEIGTK